MNDSLSTVTPHDMASAAVGAKLIWACIDVLVAVTVFAVLTKVPFLSRLVFEYDTQLDAAAKRLDASRDPSERGSIVVALARVKAARMLGLMIIMAAALIE